MADFTDIVTVITLLKNILLSGIQVDRETRERIATMTDEEVFALARELAADTDRRAGELLDRVPEEVKEEGTPVELPDME